MTLPSSIEFGMIDLIPLSHTITAFLRSDFPEAENALDLSLSLVGNLVGWGLTLRAFFPYSSQRASHNAYSRSSGTRFGLDIAFTSVVFLSKP